MRFTTSTSKITDAKRPGADDVAISNDQAAMKKEENSFDLILDTVFALFERVLKADVRHRFVIDMASLNKR